MCELAFKSAVISSWHRQSRSNNNNNENIRTLTDTDVLRTIRWSDGIGPRALQTFCLFWLCLHYKIYESKTHIPECEKRREREREGRNEQKSINSWSNLAMLNVFALPFSDNEFVVFAKASETKNALWYYLDFNLRIIIMCLWWVLYRFMRSYVHFVHTWLHQHQRQYHNNAIDKILLWSADREIERERQERFDDLANRWE